MKKQHKIPFTAALVAFLIWAPAITSADQHGPLQDAGFELKTPPSEGGWTLFEISLYSKNHARSGSQSMFNGGFSRTVPFQATFAGNASGAFQVFPAEAGSRWKLAGYGLTPGTLEGTDAYGILQVSFFDVDGKDLGTVETAGMTVKAKTSAPVNRDSAVGEWIALDTGIATAPAGTVEIHAFTLFVDYSGSGRTQGVYFDDLALCTVGEDGKCEME